MQPVENDLERYFRDNRGRRIHKWEHYFEIYDRHLSRFRGQPITVLEVGVSHGGSLRMWRDYFGPDARIFGLDVNPQCKQLEEDNICVLIGSQSDRSFLRQVTRQIPSVDVLIDDGGHMMTQQIATFEELFEHVAERGVYLCEDTHTSYWLTFGGGHKRRGTFIEYTKGWIDELHGYHSEEKSLSVTDFTRSVNSVHFYDSIVVVEKRPRSAPRQLRTGDLSFDPAIAEGRAMITGFKRLVLTTLNASLRRARLPGIKWR